MQANALTAERLHALAELYQQGHASDLMDRTLEVTVQVVKRYLPG